MNAQQWGEVGGDFGELGIAFSSQSTLRHCNLIVLEHTAA